MNNRVHVLNDNKLFETIADISYIAGQNAYYSGDSRMDIFNFISWAKEFEKGYENTDWHDENYMLTIEAFALKKLSYL